jgi:asparagine synthase (glutamine-hydrolysing)
MCGIAGISVSEGKRVSQRELRILAGAMAHRGPDDEGIFVSPDKRVGLAHRRLKVIDLKGGHQPITNEDGSKVLVFNGEIYNFKALRQDLSARGHQFSSNSDTEVIVHLYEEHGTACVDYLRGMFAFVIYDETENLFFGAVDRMGQKPLYYYHKSGFFCFASTFGALCTIQEIPKELDPAAFDQILSLTYIPAPDTIFAGVKKLPPAHRFVWTEGTVSVSRYWDIPVGPKIDISMAEAKDLTLRKIEEAVRIRLMSDVPLGAFLSGGLDSSLIVALASRHISGALDTFSIGFEHPAYNELPFAREVARTFNTHHHEFMMRPLEVDALPQLIHHFGEPYGDFSALPMWRLAEETRKHVTVALSGDGGDELFAGYGRHRMFHVYNTFRQLLPEKLVGLASRIVGLPRSENPMKRRVQRFFQMIHQPPERIFADLNVFLKPWEKDLAYTDALKNRLSSDIEGRLAAIFDRPDGTDLDRMLYTDAVTYEACQLTKVDTMSMAWSLEARCPLVDHELVELVFSFPDRFKMGLSGGKRLLKEVGKDLLPKQILDRPKRGFTIPLKYWFRDELKDYARERILKGALSEIGWINKEFLKTILDSHFDNRRDYTYHIWNFLVLSEWLDNHF